MSRGTGAFLRQKLTKEYSKHRTMKERRDCKDYKLEAIKDSGIRNSENFQSWTLKSREDFLRKSQSVYATEQEFENLRK